MINEKTFMSTVRLRQKKCISILGSLNAPVEVTICRADSNSRVTNVTQR